MPSKSMAQAKLMRAAAAGKSRQVPASVGKEFVAADRQKAQARLLRRGKAPQAEPVGEEEYRKAVAY